jgi:hypothetical protein
MTARGSQGLNLSGTVELHDGVEDVNEADETSTFRFAITSYGADYPVDGLVKRLQSGDIVVPTFDPDTATKLDVEGFQRQFVWTKPQCDRFVESLLLGLPVPGIFLFKQADGKLLVLDGQQRLRTLETFYRGVLRGREFRLGNVQDEFKGHTYTELSPEDRRRLDDSIIHATVVRQDEPSDDQSSVYLVFERLNTGGTLLQPQEIRVALFRGDLIRLLRDLNDNTQWREIFGPKSSRLKDQELILRFFAMRFWRNEYEKPMKDFLNRYCSLNRDLSIHDGHSLANSFNRTVDFLWSALRSKAFRIRSSLNAAVFDSVMVAVSERLDSSGEIQDIAGFVNSYESLIRDQDYLDVVSRATADEDYVRTRMSLAIDAMSNLR